MPANRYNPLTGASRSSAPPPPPPPTSVPAGASSTGPKPPGQKSSNRKRKGHRGGKKKRSRRKSFAILHEDSHDEGQSSVDGFYQQTQGNLSGTSIDSEALLDHRYVILTLVK